ncbi:alpha/beta hydrolase [Chryseobacterium wangxinyae]|uniref:alpha/beta hydrolase n=1 Tax=Chryseobacterium sp. CY350 TaxID=2997336 RepID=UPI002270DB17|nr:alpha/beta hydrolase [Chryseobacterium sp. CY350]MCY0977841.1 alpha/beta hydrolase [Chryseobacterium sp. CY350]WBZ94929.1 alpha/beta hydrolase [Chryseobacterium sp. CY350]
MKKVIFLYTIFFFIQFSAQEKIILWPKGEMPNSKILASKTKKKKELAELKEPELFAFLPPVKERNQKSVIIIPGGGYSKLTYDEGAFQIAKWMNSLGISAFVLNYRLPTSTDLIQKEIAPLQDIQSSIKYIRKNASQWRISPGQVGVVGTSAGGHLATMVSNISRDYTELKGDWENISTIPDFAILFCPVIDLGEYAHKGSRDSLLGENASPEKIREYSMQNSVTEKTPPTILFHNQDDTAVPPMNSILYFKEMTKNKVKGSLFIFPKGGHRFFVTDKDPLNENWKKLCADWLLTIGNK